MTAQDIRNLTFGKLRELDSGLKYETEAASKATAAARNATPAAPAAVPTPETIAAIPTSEATASDFLFQCEGAEIVPTETLVQMKTKNSSGVPVFMVHAIEGLMAPLKTIASELQRPAWGFQCVKNAPLNSISDLAKFYAQEMRKIQKKGPYHIAGYSFGASVGFEMALQLEKAGEQVVLTLVDGSPQFVKLHAKMIALQTATVETGEISDPFRKAISFFIRQFNSQISFVQVMRIPFLLRNPCSQFTYNTRRFVFSGVQYLTRYGHRG